FEVVKMRHKKDEAFVFDEWCELPLGKQSQQKPGDSTADRERLGSAFCGIIDKPSSQPQKRGRQDQSVKALTRNPKKSEVPQNASGSSGRNASGQDDPPVRAFGVKSTALIALATR